MDRAIALFLIGLLAGLVVLLVGAVISGIPVFFLWNAALPRLFDAPRISFGDAIILSMLAACLFKSHTSGS
jgi:hypothetical protein